MHALLYWASIFLIVALVAAALGVGALRGRQWQALRSSFGRQSCCLFLP